MAVASSDIGVLDMRHKRCVKRRESQPVIKVRVRCLEAGRSRSRRQEGGPMCESHCSALRSSGHAMQSACKAATKSEVRSGMQSDPFFLSARKARSAASSCLLLLALACSCSCSASQTSGPTAFRSRNHKTQYQQGVFRRHHASGGVRWVCGTHCALQRTNCCVCPDFAHELLRSEGSARTAPMM